jgi:hypothetical protein
MQNSSSINNIVMELNMYYSAVNSVMNTLVAPNCSNIAATGSKRIELGSDILRTILYIFKQIEYGSFDQNDYFEVKRFYNVFISGSF